MHLEPCALHCDASHRIAFHRVPPRRTNSSQEELPLHALRLRKLALGACRRELELSRSHPLGCSVGALELAGQLTSRPPSCRPEGVGAGSVSGSLFDSFQESHSGSHSGSILGRFWVPFWVHFEARIKVETKREPEAYKQQRRTLKQRKERRRHVLHRTASHRVSSHRSATRRNPSHFWKLHRSASHRTQRSAPRRLPEHCESGISESG